MAAGVWVGGRFAVEDEPTTDGALALSGAEGDELDVYEADDVLVSPSPDRYLTRMASILLPPAVLLAVGGVSLLLHGTGTGTTATAGSDAPAAVAAMPTGAVDRVTALSPEDLIQKAMADLSAQNAAAAPPATSQVLSPASIFRSRVATRTATVNRAPVVRPAPVSRAGVAPVANSPAAPPPVVAPPPPPPAPAAPPPSPDPVISISPPPPPVVTPPSDTGTPPSDTGTPPSDTGTPPSDTGTPPSDTGTPPSDTGTPPTP